MNMHNWLLSFQTPLLAASLHQHACCSSRDGVGQSACAGGVRESDRNTPADLHGLVTTPSFLHSIAARPPSSFFSFSQTTHSWSGKSHRKQYRNKNKASTGEEGTTLSFRIRQPPFKLYQTPVLPSVCRNVSFNTEKFYCPTFPLSWWYPGDKSQRWPYGASARLTS